MNYPTNVFDDVNQFQNVPRNIRGAYTCESSVYYVIKISLEESEILSCFSKIQQKLLQQSRYRVTKEEEGNYMIYDRETWNRVQMTYEPRYESVLLYPFVNCKPKTMRDLYSVIREKIGEGFVSISAKKLDNRIKR